MWTILYGMMGYASHLVAEVAVKNLDPATRDTAMGALGLYYAQLALNFAWMPLFFSGECGSGLWRVSEKGAWCEKRGTEARAAREPRRSTPRSPLTSAKRPIVALADIGVLAATVFAMTDIMNVLPTRIPTIYLLAPYCGWLCYGECGRGAAPA